MSFVKTISIKGDEGSDWAQILALFLSCLVSFSCGCLFSWPSPSITKLLADDYHLNISIDAASYLAVLPPAAAVICAFPAASLVDIVGRKYGLLFTAVPHLLSWILIASEYSIWTFYAARFINGLGDALTFSTVPVYIGEITTPKMRGSWGNMITFMLFCGGFLVNVIGAYYSIRTTAIALGCAPVIFLICFPFIPESPYFYIIKGNYEAARKSLRWFRQKDNVEEELKEIDTAVKRQLAESGTIKDLFMNKANRKAVIIGATMRFTQQFAGISAFVVYSQYLFLEAGGDMSASTSAIICAAIMWFVGFLGSALLERVGRRKSMLISGYSCEVLLLAMGTYMVLKANMDLSFMSWFPIVGMMAFLILFSFGLGVVPTLMLGELFSSSIKSKGLAMMNVCFGIYIACSTKIFQVLVATYGLGAPFFFFAASCLLGTTICYFITPETTGKTLDEIQLEMQGIKVVKKATKNIEHIC